MSSVRSLSYGRLMQVTIDEFDTVTVGSGCDIDLPSAEAEQLMRDLMDHFGVEDLADKIETLDDTISTLEDEIAELKRGASS
jgi:hypothetical protein